MEKSRILIIGATGSLGYHLVEASLQFGHSTFALVRDSAFSDPNKSHKLHSLSNAGVTLLKGSLEDESSLVDAVNQVDVVICAVPTKDVLSQKLLIQVIKKAGSIKRFVPAEFGADPDKTRVSELDHNFYSRKAEIRRLIEAEEIPYTLISCNFFMRVLLPSLVQPGRTTPPRDKVTIFGNGDTNKGVFVKERDVAAFTIKAVDDPRALNKVVYLRPPGNVYSMNELVELWETKIGKKLEKTFVSEQELLARVKGNELNFANKLTTKVISSQVQLVRCIRVSIILRYDTSGSRTSYIKSSFSLQGRNILFSILSNLTTIGVLK